MATTPQALWDIATRLRDASEQIFSDAGFPVERAYVSDGQVAFESCDTLAVQFIRSFRGLPGAENITSNLCAQPRTASFAIWVIRCAGQVQADATVDIADIEIAAEQRLVDSWVLQSGLSILAASGDWCECESVVIGESSITGPQGMLGAVKQLVSIQIGACMEGS